MPDLFCRLKTCTLCPNTHYALALSMTWAWYGVKGSAKWPPQEQKSTARKVSHSKYLVAYLKMRKLGKCWFYFSRSLLFWFIKLVNFVSVSAVIIASVFFGLLFFFCLVGFIGYRLLHKGFRQGFNLPSLSRPPKE